MSFRSTWKPKNAGLVDSAALVLAIVIALAAAFTLIRSRQQQDSAPAYAR